MANKPFAIQGSTLTIGGFDLQAGSNGVVIPGVTQAANYKVEEVDENGSSENQDLGSNAGAITVIDNAEYVYQSGGAQSSGTYQPAAYTVEELDDGNIEEINVESQGVYETADKTRAEAANMWATLTADPFETFNTANWIQIPFRPKMRAGEVENIGGGGSGDSIDNGAYSVSVADTGVVTMSTSRGTVEFGALPEPGGPQHFHIMKGAGQDGSGGVDLYFGDDFNYVLQRADSYQGSEAYGVEIGANDRDGGDQHVWRFDPDGDLHIPPGKTIRDAMTGDDLLAGAGGGAAADANIWVQTFVSDTPLTDFPQIATSVEYDSDGNVIGLFSHFDDEFSGVSYFSVGKYTPSGTKIWTARLSDSTQTDGWGLAVDSVDGWIYVAGQSDGVSETYPYNQATLTKIDPVNGSYDWHRVYDFGYASASAVVDVDSDGNPIMVGYVDVGGNSNESYLAVTKIAKADGAVTWSRKLDGQADEQAYGMAVGPNDEVVAVGYMSQLGLGSTNAVATVVTVPSSNVNWTTQYGSGDGTNENYQGIIFDIIVTNGVPAITIKTDPVGNRTIGDTIMTLPGDSFGGVNGVDDMVVNVASVSAVGDTDDRIVVVKYNSSGAIQWQRAIQFDSGFDCTGADADIDSQGNVYICGQYGIDPGGNGMALIKFNSAGVKQWSRRVVGNCISVATSIVVGPDDKLYISGVNGNVVTETFVWVVAKYSLDGLVEWQRFMENTTTWTFSGQLFNNLAGGSNLAVRQGYVALAGGFGNLEAQEQTYATLVQVPASGSVFTVGNWDFKAANLSGVLNASASDITVIDAGLTDSDNAGTIEGGPIVGDTEVSNFLIGTLYTAPGGNNSLVNSGNQLTLETTGAVTLPAGGTISEGYVTSNPTIQLTPASPSVASQKLVIKGGGTYTYTDNGIEINYNNNTGIVGDTLTFTIYSTAYNGQTLYWWINPEGAGIGDSESGTVTITGNTGQINILIDSDDYEFTLRVSPENNNYNPATTGVESGLINASAPTFDSEHHLHLTTGDLTETSIFLGTDNHNVRTNTDGTIQVTTTYYGAVASVASINSQGGYNTGTYTGLTTTGGTGSGLTVNATSTGGYIGVITVVNPGKGYTDDDVLTLVGGDGLGCTFVINVPTGTSEWQFNTDGSITFPTQTTPDYANRTDSYTTGPTLQLAKNGTDSTVVITGPAATEANPYAKRLVIQGQPGWRGWPVGNQPTGAEGGDVYIWGGYGGEGSDQTGDGGDVKLRGGHGGQNGGYVRVEAGEANSNNGVGGFLDLNAGDALQGYFGGANAQGGPVQIRGGRGYGQGGAVNIHTATTDTWDHQWTFAKDGILTFPDGTTNSGDTVISTSTYNIQSIGNTLIQTSANAGAKTWTFGTTGRTTFPNGTVPEHSYGAAGDKEGMVVFSDPYIYYCKQDFVPNSTNVMTLGSSGSSVWVSSTDYAGDLVANFTANSTGWTYNGVTLINISVDNQFGPGYLLEGVTGFSTMNGDRYTLESPNLLLDIWVRVAWTGTNW